MATLLGARSLRTGSTDLSGLITQGGAFKQPSVLPSASRRRLWAPSSCPPSPPLQVPSNLKAHTQAHTQAHVHVARGGRGSRYRDFASHRALRLRPTMVQAMKSATMRRP